MAVLDEDISACYDMGLKEFEHSLFFFIGYVKVYGGVQIGNGTGQDEDSVGDEDSRSEC